MKGADSGFFFVRSRRRTCFRSKILAFLLASFKSLLLLLEARFFLATDGCGQARCSFPGLGRSKGEVSGQNKTFLSSFR